MANLARWRRGVAVLGVSAGMLVGCRVNPPPPTPVQACKDGLPGPRVRYGSQNLYPTVGDAAVGIPPSQPHDLRVHETGQPAMFWLDGSDLGGVFEICVHTDPPAVTTHLGGAQVTGQLTNPAPSAGPGPFAFWQMFFAQNFLNPLQDSQTDAAGVLQVDVAAVNLRQQLATRPPGAGSTGTMRFTFQVGGGVRYLDISVAPLP